MQMKTSAWTVEDICSEDDEDDADYASVASDARYFPSDIFAKGGPESEDEEKQELDQSDTERGNLIVHAELEGGIYVSPLSPPPTQARVTPSD